MISGLVYVGVFVLMFFILGCFIVKGFMKWVLLGVIIFFILFLWGKNFMGLIDFFIDYILMYNKFWVVFFILVIVEFIIFLFVIFILKEIFIKLELLKEKLKYIYISFGLIGGLVLFFVIVFCLFFFIYILGNEMVVL